MKPYSELTEASKKNLSKLWSLIIGEEKPSPSNGNKSNKSNKSNNSNNIITSGAQRGKVAMANSVDFLLEGLSLPQLWDELQKTHDTIKEICQDHKVFRGGDPQLEESLGHDLEVTGDLGDFTPIISIICLLHFKGIRVTNQIIIQVFRILTSQGCTGGKKEVGDGQIRGFFGVKL